MWRCYEAANKGEDGCHIALYFASNVASNIRVASMPCMTWHTTDLTQVDEQGNITESCFKTFGCGSAIASSSVATEWYVAAVQDAMVAAQSAVACVSDISSAVPTCFDSAHQVMLPTCSGPIAPEQCIHHTDYGVAQNDMCFRVKGKSIDEVLTIKNSDIAKHLSLPPVKLHCSMLAEDAIKAAVKDVQAKRAKMAASKQQQELNQMEQPDSGEKLAAAVAS